MKNSIKKAIKKYPDLHISEDAIIYNRTSISRRMGENKFCPTSVFLKNSVGGSRKSPKVSKKDRDMCMNVFGQVFDKFLED